MLVVMGSLVKDLCLGTATDPCSITLPLSPTNYQQVIFVIEAILAVPFLMKHMSEVMRFNLASQPPDSIADDVALRFTRTDAYVGVRGSNVFEVTLERQADLIESLLDRNRTLTELVSVLERQRTQGNPPSPVIQVSSASNC